MHLFYGFQVHPDNVPLSQPGVYLITQLETEMRYVGSSKNVANRVKEWARGAGNVPQLQEVIRQHSGKRSKSRRHAFLVEPLFYMLEWNGLRKGLLTQVEDAMIEEYNCVNHGWNLPRANVADLSKLPDAIEKRRVTEASAETKARRSTEMLRRWSDPDYANRTMASMRTTDLHPSRSAKIASARLGTRLTNGKWVKTCT